MRTSLALTAIAVSALALSGCDRLQAAYKAFSEPAAPASSDTTGPAPSTPSSGPLTARGEAITLTPDTTEYPQYAASVVRVDDLADQGQLSAKLFGTAGGDPAMNGLYTYIAFFESPAEGWRVFQLGDFLDYRILGETPGRVDLEIDESSMNTETGEIGQRTKRIIVTWGRREPGAPMLVFTRPAA